jgi:23S rRNA pseudouridine1911/1915/1917 synthase
MDCPDQERRIVADRGDDGRRLDHVIRRHLAGVPDATRTRVQAWIGEGAVTVNGWAVRRAAARVAAGDVLTVALPAYAIAPRPAMPAQDLALDILYEDEHLIAVNKTAGIVVHPTYRHGDGTVMNALLWRARGWRASDRPSIVGRLDKLTSGIVVAAKSARAHAGIQRALAGTGADKQYLALVYGRVAASRGTINLGLRRDPRDRRRVVASAAAGARSLTRYERLGRARAAPVGLALLKCTLVTGRMHQIRVHLAATGWPLVGDAKYGQPLWRDVGDPALRDELRAFTRQALHAWRLTIRHPLTGLPVHIEAPLPADLRGLLTAAGLVQCAR